MAELKSTKELREQKKENTETQTHIHIQDKQKVWMKLCNIIGQSLGLVRTWKGEDGGKSTLLQH